MSPHRDSHRPGPADLGLSAPDLQRLRRTISALHRWYRAEARQLPWRTTRDPYAIWVSEVMLQQTRVATVIPYFERWMKRFPTVAALAAADEAEVLLAWEGLGYYSRARRLHAAARRLADDDERVPRDPERFGALPGVGAYTTAAVCSIAFGAELAAVDGNVRRVLARLCALERSVDDTGVQRSLQWLADQLLTRGRAGLHNQAMMELGALVCTPRGPRCEACPLARACKGRAGINPQRYPIRAPRRTVPHQHWAIGVVERGGLLLLYRRPYDGLLAGLWDFPGARLYEGSDPLGRLQTELRDRFGLRTALRGELPAVGHAYTHLRVTLHPLRLVARDQPQRAADPPDSEVRWVDRSQLEQLAMPRASHKILELVDQVE